MKRLDQNISPPWNKEQRTRAAHVEHGGGYGGPEGIPAESVEVESLGEGARYLRGRHDGSHWEPVSNRLRQSD